MQPRTDEEFGIMLLKQCRNYVDTRDAILPSLGRYLDSLDEKGQEKLKAELASSSCNWKDTYNSLLTVGIRTRFFEEDRQKETNRKKNEPQKN